MGEQGRVARESRSMTLQRDGSQNCLQRRTEKSSACPNVRSARLQDEKASSRNAMRSLEVRGVQSETPTRSTGREIVRLP